jgi:diguanylate cyclase (GGDEF)-like protein/PAS domain S-box-containing protein
MASSFYLMMCAAALIASIGLCCLILRSRRAWARTSANDRCFRAIVEHANEGILVAEAASGRILEMNPALLRKLGYRREDLSSLNISDVLIETVIDAAGATDQRTTLARTTREVMQRSRDGTLIAIDLSASGIDAAGQPAICYIMRDATSRKTIENKMLQRHSEAEQRAQYLAQCDALTGLANRASLKVSIRDAIAASEHAGIFALLLLDLNDFRSLNDTQGSDAGDSVLVEVANRLKRVVNGHGHVARVGSDEFALTVQPIADGTAAAKIAQEVQNALAVPMRYLNHQLQLTANVGISLCPSDGQDADTLLSHADLALSEAKSCGRGSVQFFNSQMNAQVRQRLEMVSALKQALEGDELTVHYQPVVEITSRRVLSLEALVRWQHPRLGMISPGEFIPLAEETGLIVPLGERILRLVCRQVVQWERDGVPVVPVAVNLSPQQFQRQSVSQLVQSILRETGMAAHLLALEITEGSLMSDVRRYANDLQILRTAGVRILVDDFGTGYSSLSYLKHLPLDTLKIDRSFVSQVDTNSADEAIVSAILAMARSLGLKVVAEGVETKNQLAVLERHGCQMAQGYYFGRPVPAEQCLTLLWELSKRPSFTDTLRMQLNDVPSGEPRLTIVRRKTR